MVTIIILTTTIYETSSTCGVFPEAWVTETLPYIYLSRLGSILAFGSDPKALGKVNYTPRSHT